MQRTLFRMQHDLAFAARLRARDAEAIASTGLGDADLALLLSASPAAVEADAGGKRLAQFLRNVASEHALTVACSDALAVRHAHLSLLESFPSSRHFHAAIREDRRLPLSFAEHALEVAEASGEPFLIALAQLEGAMARVRRGSFTRGEAPAGGFVLAGCTEVLELPGGAVHAAGELRRALDAGLPAPAPALDAARTEHALILGTQPLSPHRLGEASLEVLSPLAGALLSMAREPVSAARLAAFCAVHDVEAAEIDGFLGSLQADGVIVAGPAARTPLP